MHGHTHHNCAYCAAEFDVDDYDTDLLAIAYNPTASMLLELGDLGDDGYYVRRVPDNGTSRGACPQYDSDKQASNSFLSWFHVGQGWAR